MLVPSNTSDELLPAAGVDSASSLDEIVTRLRALVELWTAELRLAGSINLIDALLVLLLPPLLYGFHPKLSALGERNYYRFSRDVFARGRTEYFSESMLYPLLASLAGANGSKVAFAVFGLVTSYIWFMCVAANLRRCNERGGQIPTRLLIVVMLTHTTAESFWSLWRGYPDALTASAASMLVFGQQGWLLAGASVVGTLSHATIFTLAAVLILLLRRTAGHFPFVARPAFRRLALPVAGGLLVGRVLLALWYWSFDYQLVNRLQWARNQGWAFWFDYNRDVVRFLLDLQPASYWLLCVLLLALLARHARQLAVGLTGGAAVAGVAQFFATDRPRVFVSLFWPQLLFALGETSRSKTVPLSWKRLVVGALLLVVSFRLLPLVSRVF